jgi:hypothetical protein
VIFADADGASKFEDLSKLEMELKRIEKDGVAVAVGSRAHMVHSAAVVQVPPSQTHHLTCSARLFAILRCMRFIRFCISLGFEVSRIHNVDSNYSLEKHVR